MFSRLAPFVHDLDMGSAAAADEHYREGEHKLRILRARQPSVAQMPNLEKVAETAERFEEDDLLANPAEFARTFGYQQGYNKGPVDYEHLAKIIQRFFPADVRADDYEAIYVDGHRDGFEARLDRDEYAQKHGAKRGPHAPDMGLPLTL